MNRLDRAEMLDRGLGSPADVAENLAEMWQINRCLGGFRALTRHLYPRLARLAAAQDFVTLADLGTGSADMPRMIALWARARGFRVRVFAVDRAARNLSIARGRAARIPEVTLLHAEAGCLPLPAQGVDFVVSSQFLHHLLPRPAVEMLRSAFTHARAGIVMSDLVRGWLPYFAFKSVQPVFARNALTRHDGALSIRRAYTPAELRQLAASAGLTSAAVYAHWPWRMTLVADK